MSEYNFSDIEFSENSDPRCPVVLVLDVSSSMAEPFPGEKVTPLEALNSGLDVLVSELNKDILARRRVEVSIVAFGSKVNPATPFSTVENLVLPNLEPSGTTSMGAAIERALDAINERKSEYKKNGIQFYRPWILLITDGLPTDNIENAAKRVHDMEERKSVAFFSVGVEGADFETLSKISKRTPLKLSGIKFSELFVWLSASQSSVSASNPGDTVSLPSPEGWAEV